MFCFALCACTGNKKPATLHIIWQKERAAALSIPSNLLPGTAVGQDLKVMLKENPNVDGMLGTFKTLGDSILFTPVVPFVPGKEYVISWRNKDLGSIRIPVRKGIGPQVAGIYPAPDTLPENLLKIYLCFSRPMREGESKNNVAMLNSRQDTLEDVFLDLQPELWNDDRTVLTLWLNPGRIKRDLQPNMRSGNPLKSGEKYTIAISKDWKDAEGVSLANNYYRSFTASARDGVSPDLQKWRIQPGENLKSLKIFTDEPLDHFLSLETLSILDNDRNEIKGRFSAARDGRRIVFRPEKVLRPGIYILEAEPRLEDLAGNNLERPFDRDLQAKQKRAQPGFTRSFFVK